MEPLCYNRLILSVTKVSMYNDYIIMIKTYSFRPVKGLTILEKSLVRKVDVVLKSQSNSFPSLLELFNSLTF